MTNAELLEMVFKHAKDYRNSGVNGSINRNAHMNRCRTTIDQDAIDAVLVDFVNYIGMQHGVDFGAYVSDLGKMEE